jgi:photosystem II stability/assembly factor-like uncharacterized protein
MDDDAVLLAADGALLTSTDSGRTWTDLGTPGLYDIAVHPADPATLVGTTEAGPRSSAPTAAGLSPRSRAPVLGLLTWADTGLYGITPTGTARAFSVSSDADLTFTDRKPSPHERDDRTDGRADLPDGPGHPPVYRKMYRP